jgi:hypothetical protein
MSFMNFSEPNRQIYNPWSSAVGYLSYQSRGVSDEGFVEDASGWKVAHLADPEIGSFIGYAFGRYRLVDNARCEREKEHESPVSGCDCGFYAMKERFRAEFLLERWRQLVLLKVELYGRIIEHRDGYRAQEQEITSMLVPARCSKGLCKGLTAGMRKGKRYWRTVCESHMADGLSLADLRSMMKLDIVSFSN